VTFEIISEIEGIETFAVGRSIRELPGQKEFKIKRFLEN